MLCAAIDEFTEFGLGAATMEGVASRAEVSKRTLYKHFPNKLLLFDAVVDLLLERISPLGKLTYDPAQKFGPQLRDVARQEMQLLCDPAFVRLSRIVMIECMRSQAQSQRLMQKFDTVECAMYAWFTSAGAAGVLGELEPQLAAELFLAPLKGLAYWHQAIIWQPPLDAETQQRVIDEACEGLLRRVGHATAGR